MSPSRTIHRCLVQAAITLQHTSETSRLDAEVLLAAVLQRDRTYLYAYSETLVAEAIAQVFFQHVARRQRGEPIAHITGSREFWSLPISVNNSTLIPRPDTELLVETALHLCDKENARVLDLGTGTGAIALALAKEKDTWQIDAVDKQADAVQLAQHNADVFALCNVRIYESDWFIAVPDSQCFDVVISNPPYIAADDKHLLQGDVRFEPRSALVAADEGYADLFFIVRTAKTFLCDAGLLLLEHGYAQGEKLRAYLQQCGYSNIHTVRDYSGNERVTHAVWRFEVKNG